MNSVEKFIAEFPVKPHDKEKVECEIIYYFYTRFCIDNNIKPLHYVPFFRTFKKKGFINTLINRKPRSIDRAYYVSKELFKLTEEEYLNFRRQQRYIKYIWREKQKAGKISGKNKQKRVKLKRKLTKLKEKLVKKHSKPGTKSATSDSTDGSSQK